MPGAGDMLLGLFNIKHFRKTIRKDNNKYSESLKDNTRYGAHHEPCESDGAEDLRRFHPRDEMQRPGPSKLQVCIR